MKQLDDGFIGWDFNEPGISFNLREGRIILFKSTLQALQHPEYYRFLFDADGLRFAVQVCAMDEKGSHRLPETLNKEHFAAKSMELVRFIYRACNWNRDLTYRIPGAAIPEVRMVTFDLKEALELHEWRLKERQTFGEADNGEMD